MVGLARTSHGVSGRDRDGTKNTVINDDELIEQGKALGLTRRESQVISLITRGMSNAEIAEATYLSINSVKTYIRSTYRKIDVSRRAQAVVWGMKNGFGHDDEDEPVPAAEAEQSPPAGPR